MERLFDIFIKMTWINYIVDGLFSLLNLDMELKIVKSVNFFFYEMIKIFLLLTVIIFVISFIQSYFPPQKTKEMISKYKGIKSNIIAAIMGIISPFCACSSIPIFIGINKAGAPLGSSFSFLIASPLIDMASLIFLINIFGLKVGIIYTSLGIILAVVGGIIIDKLKLEKEILLEKPSCSQSCCCSSDDRKNLNNDTKQIDDASKNRFSYSKQQTLAVIKKIWIYIIISIAVGSIIYNYIPQNIIESILGRSNYFSVIIATIIGVPIYTDEMSSMIIAKAFYDKNVPIGTVVSFMISAAALSLPSITMLKSIMSIKLLSIFVSIVVVGVIIIGYALNLLHFIF